MTGRIPRERENVVYRASDLIGSTPLLELVRTGTGTRLLLKLEQFNPTGSSKVRMAREMVLQAERSGELRPGGHIVEPTSGNTGAGLALIALERGYTFTAVVDDHAAADKLRVMRAMGAHLFRVENGGAVPSTVERRRIAAEIAAKVGAYRPDQHNNPHNNTGYKGLASELLVDLNADLDYLVGAVGTGGSLCGTTAELRRLGSSVRAIGVEPVGSIIFGGPGGGYWQTGSGSPPGFPVGSNVDYDAIDEGCRVGDIDAFATARVVARRTGLLVGGTAGAAIHLALRRLVHVPAASTVVVLVCDAGEKYLDTVYDDDWLLERDLYDEAATQRVLRMLRAYDESVRLAECGVCAAEQTGT
ncbi:PLP-dependent cysteine synthase family protein [Nocardia seriolae]|uniref:Cystathionine beta-synthase n=1 Tax=Nocardia seriolae TaxID=37332 RepID=A0ABC9Z2D0_9NOCA|nr:cysteine synthase family protein [Nocardia seriolae]BEK98397.1 cysteine synthase family protein [Nocardia seriolae]GAM49701.1 cysteine synthase [Nocardia seriolae]GAP31715.1 cystathionine beta-synthase [Nocardia seriolae]GEM27358.1 cysteine synthase [Nocardia seriolae NBRC 15557]